MNAYRFRPGALLLLLLLLPVCGCKALSEKAYRLGRALDPDLHRCDPVPNCALCGETGPGSAFPAAAPPIAGYPGPLGDCQTGGLPVTTELVDPLAPGNGLNIQQELLSIREQANRSESLVNQMRGELLGRNDELIKARADYSRVQQEVASMRQNMTAWQNDTQQLHEALKHRDKRRLETLDEMATSFAHLSAEPE